MSDWVQNWTAFWVFMVFCAEFYLILRAWKLARDNAQFLSIARAMGWLSDAKVGAPPARRNWWETDEDEEQT